MSPRFRAFYSICPEFLPMKDWARSFYHSKPWLQVRDFVIRRDRGMCQRCLREGRVNVGEIVHHEIPLTPQNIDDPDIALNPERLEYVCKECHEAIHAELGEGALNGRKPVELRVTFDEYGNVLPR